MNERLKLQPLYGLMLTLSLAGPAVAASPMNVVYVNGIQNTLVEAQKTRQRIQATLDVSPNHIGADRKSFSVIEVWNPVGWYGTEDGEWDLTQDLKELFLLKTAEEHFAADFPKIMVPFINTSVTIDREAASRVASYLYDMTPGDNSLEASLVSPVTDAHMDATQKAANQLADAMVVLHPVVVVAHSQGNLLANLAYASLAYRYGDVLSKMVRVVNVANTAMFSVNNLDFTHAGDAALYSKATSIHAPDKSLETLPSRGNDWTRTTPACSNAACNFTLATTRETAPFNAQNDIDGQGAIDMVLDHSITETYMSTANVTVNPSNPPAVTFTPDRNRFIDRFEDFIYAAANSFSGRLNDTGITASQCYQADSDALVSCSSAGALALNNAQDGMTGRDANPLTNDSSDGKLGFSFSEVDGDCVLDNVTGLMWQRYVSQQGFTNYSPDYDPAGEYGSATDGSGYVASINASGLCGYHDWRLPSADELQSIVDFGVVWPGPTIDASWFPNTLGAGYALYWSASPYLRSAGSAWIIDFNGGHVHGANRRGDVGYVRLVRAGQ